MQSAFINCVFWGNAALGDPEEESDNRGLGGAIRNTSGDAENPTLVVNCTFSGNSTTMSGGAIFNLQWYGNRGFMTIVNSIFWGNDAPDAELVGSRIEASHSLVAGGWEGEGNIDADPLFVDAAAGDLRLQPGSPAIDAGDPMIAPDADILGTPRPQGTEVDMGAYEFMEGDPVVVPDLVIDGWTLEDVEAALTAAGLNVGTITQVYSDDVPEGGVIGQDPAAGSEIPEGSAVNLVISRGPAPVEMPLNGLHVMTTALVLMTMALVSRSILRHSK